MDESGNWGPDDTDSVFVTAGYISSEDRWQEFSREWVSLGLKKGLKARKALKNATVGKSNDCIQIAQLIKKYALLGIECPIDLSSYRRCAKGKIHTSVDQPYFWAFHETIQLICKSCIEIDASAQVELIFDEKDGGSKWERWYDLARLKYFRPEHRAILPRSIQWKSDDDVLALKSADMLAGFARRFHNGQSKEIDGIGELLGSVKIMSFPEPLSDAYFNAALASEADQLEGDDIEEWKTRWKNTNL